MAELNQSLYNIDNKQNKYSFAEYPSIKIYKKSSGSGWYNHLLFGDYIKIINPNIVNGRVYARSRNNNGWVKVTELRKDRTLEVNFVDIGQGDGCHVVTPDDKHLIIDAGATDNMNRYLTWRFNLYKRKTKLPFDIDLLISHSDKDHYYGFDYVFKNDKISINKVYHNGLVERPGRSNLGRVEKGHITGLVKTTTQMKRIITKASNRKGKNSMYCKTLYKSLKNNPDIEFESLALKDNFIENFDDTNKIQNKQFSYEILGPITKKTNGKDSLKTIKNLGKDKNGHSVILKLTFDKLKILLGGDVNEEFGEIIHEHFKKKNELDRLTVDVAKACHHGSNHFSYDFVQSINANATVISSGDDESYSHPRPDTIGALGKCGYGHRPLIFSTELARSNKDITTGKLEKIAKTINKIKALDKQIKEETDQDKKKVLIDSKRKLNRAMNSFLTKYGMINVRSDGRRTIIAQKLETPASYGKWDIHQLEYSNGTKRFELV